MIDLADFLEELKYIFLGLCGVFVVSWIPVFMIDWGYVFLPVAVIVLLTYAGIMCNKISKELEVEDDKIYREIQGYF